MLIAILFALSAAEPRLQQLVFAHTPEWLVSAATPETKLIGISVSDDSLADVEKRFGKPSKVSRDPEGATEAEYTWNKGDLILRVSTMFAEGTTTPAEEHVYSVTVIGNRSVRAAKAGGGIRLGDNFARLLSIYGNKYQTGYRKNLGDSLTVIFVFSDDTELAAELDDDGIVTALQLTSSED